MVLVGESGGTKTSWIIVDQNRKTKAVNTIGLNPLQTTEEQFIQTISTLTKDQIFRIYFFSAGCNQDSIKERVKGYFRQVFGEKVSIEILTDIEAAAFALSANDESYVGILGTGSNLVHVRDGKVLTDSCGHGFILGDFGSGAVLGKSLLRDFLHRLIPKDIEAELQKQYQLDRDLILNRVYKDSHASAFLGQFAPFVLEHEAHKYCKALLDNHFKDYFKYIVEPVVDLKSLPIHLVGGFATAFENKIRTAALYKGYQIGNIIQSPGEFLVRRFTGQ